MIRWGKPIAPGCFSLATAESFPHLSASAPRPSRATGALHSGSPRTLSHRARGRSCDLSCALDDSSGLPTSRVCQAPFATERSRVASPRSHCDLRGRAVPPKRCGSKRDCQSLQPIRQQHLPARRRLRDQHRPDLPKSWHRRRRHGDLDRRKHCRGRSACELAGERAGRTDDRWRLSPSSMVSTGVNDGEGYGGGFYWAGGGAETHDGEQGAGFGPFWSSYFGFQLICGANPCRSGTSQFDVGEADLYVQETVGPSLVSPDGLWQSSGWIRGDWNLHFWGDSPSGLCAVGATINGQSVASVSLRAEPPSGISAALRRSRRRSTHGSTAMARCRSH